MIGVLRLRNSVQAYDWGSREAIPRLLGQAPSEEPQAELWMGAHPKAPSHAELDGAWLPLDEVIAERPEAMLGAEVARAFGGGLPFLMKILAAGRPLSIQAHPNLQQARAGFERENRAGLPAGDPVRNYRDASHKPEILYALTPFTALRGFRSAEEIDHRVRSVGLDDVLPSFGKDPRRFLSRFLTLDGDPLDTARTGVLGRTGRLDPLAAHWIERLETFYPGDRGVLAPVFMQLVELRPGEALFTGPGVLHAYLSGLGIELMANSDNVLRGGLTHKHVDAEELLSIATFGPESGLVEPTRRGGCVVFETPADEFQLSVIHRKRADGALPLPLGPGPAGARLFLCTEGEGELRTMDGKRFLFARGDSFFMTPEVRDVELLGSGKGNLSLFCARVAGCPAALSPA